MKINRISFSNVNSLKGKHLIDFDQRPISDAGIFAIVGPTGAGKSTILDVITLALYNKVPRFGQVSKNEIEKLGSIITYATSDASAEVTYTVKGITYRSSWSIQKNRNNNWNDYHMELVNVTDQESIFPINRSEVPSKNASIIGLDFDQFVKSILLCQGDFDQFLKSNAKDRAELIEKLTGTTIYRSLGVKAFEKSKLFTEKFKQLQFQLDQSIIMSGEEISSINENEQFLNLELQRITKEIEKSQNQDTILTKATQLNAKINGNKRLLEENNQSVQEFKSNEVKIARHESLSPYRSEISEYSRLSKVISNQNAQHEQLLKLATQLHQTKQTILFDLKPLLEVNEGKADVIQLVSILDIEYNTLKTKMEEIKDDGSKLRKKIIELQNNTIGSDAKGLISIIDPNKALEAIKTRITEYNYNITEHKLNDITINELISLEVTIMDDVNKETHQRHLIENIKKKINIYILNEKDNQLNSDKRNSLIAELANIETKFTEKNEILKYLKNSKGLKLDELRNSLVIGENCPLCGSIVEDFSKLPILELGQIVLDIDTIESDLKKMNTSIHLSNNNLIDLNSKFLSIETFNRTLKDDVISQGFNIQSNEEMDKLIDLSNVKIRDQSKKLQEIRGIKEIKLNVDILILSKSLFEELSQIMQDYIASDKLFKDKYKGIEVTAILTKFRNSFTEINSDILRNSTLLANLSAELHKNNQTFAVLNNKLSISLSNLDIESIDFAISLLLDEIDYQRLKKQKEVLIEKQNNLKTLIGKDQIDYKELEEELKKIESTDLLELRQIIASKNNQKSQILLDLGKIGQQLLANKQAINTKLAIEKSLLSTQKEGRRWELLKNIIGDAKGSIFSSYAQNLTLNHLIKLANQRLKGFTDRYLIHTPTQDKDLEIIDTYQSNAIRAVKTLSGGETFLISLAMALSLSDLASRNVNLESLFIDEGFGTLDTETLDVALDSLESLKNDSGKTIGIISHVEPLKERITTQIVLSKNGQGFSTLNVIPQV